jgi:hypothetical protein
MWKRFPENRPTEGGTHFVMYMGVRHLMYWDTEKWRTHRGWCSHVGVRQRDVTWFYEAPTPPEGEDQWPLLQSQ